MTSIYPRNGTSNGDFPITVTGYGFGHNKDVIRTLFTSKRDPNFIQKSKVDTLLNGSFVVTAPSSNVDISLDMKVVDRLGFLIFKQF